VDFKNVCLAGLATICRRFFVDYLWIICGSSVDFSSICRRLSVDHLWIICGFFVDLSSITGLVDGMYDQWEEQAFYLIGDMSALKESV
jgi:hypothetical protein